MFKKVAGNHSSRETQSRVREAFQSRPKVLFYAPILEYPPAGGPQISVVNAIKVLHRISELHILTSVPPSQLDSEPARAFLRSHSHAVGHVPTSFFAGGPSAIDRLLRLIRRSFAQLFARVDGKFILEYAESHQIDIIWVDRVLEHAFPMLVELRRRDTAAVLVADTCAVYSRFILRELPHVRNPSRRLLIRRRGRRKELEERRLTVLADAMTAVSELDAAHFRSVAPSPDKVHVFSNVVDLGAYEGTRAGELGLRTPNLLLAGSFGHQNSPMDRAARWVAKEVMPRVLEEIPDAHLYIVGRNSDQTQSALNNDSVTVVGSVPDIVPYLNSAVAMLVSGLATSKGLTMIREALALGSVASLGEVYITPLSVPASYANSSMTTLFTHEPSSRSDSELTPTNQSGLGAIIETRVTRGKSTLTSNVSSTLPGEGEIPPPHSKPSAIPAWIAASTSESRGVFLPSSAMFLIPSDARDPSAQNVTVAACVPPMRPENEGCRETTRGACWRSRSTRTRRRMTSSPWSPRAAQSSRPSGPSL